MGGTPFSGIGFLGFGWRFNNCQEIEESSSSYPDIDITIFTVLGCTQTPKSDLRPKLTFLDGHLDPLGAMRCFGDHVEAISRLYTLRTTSKRGPCF